MTRYLYVLLALLFMCSCAEKPENTNAGSHVVDDFIYYGEPFQNVPSVDDMRIYSLSPRFFAKQNALQAVRERLDSIQMLNVNVIWVLPVFLKSETRVPYGSPYSMRDFYQLDPEYGTVADLRGLVADAHSRGIAVILDLITKHTGSDCQWVKTHPDWYKLTETLTSPAFTPESFTDGVEFDWSNPELRAELVKLMKYWIAVANIDGYRCDSASEVPLEVWSDAISTLRSSLEDRKLVMLAEVAQADYLGSGFDLVYGWHFGATLEKVFTGEWSVNSLFTKNEEEMTSAAEHGAGKSRMRFSTNHDYAARNAPSSLYNSQDGANAAFVIAMTMGGVPMVYASQEIGYPQKLSFFKNNAVVMDWESNPETFRLYCSLMDVADDPVLRLGTLTKISNTDVVSFVREYDNQKILVLVNVRGATSEFTLPEAYLEATYTDMLTGEDIRLSSGSLSAYSYKILKLKK